MGSGASKKKENRQPENVSAADTHQNNSELGVKSHHGQQPKIVPAVAENTAQQSGKKPSKTTQSNRETGKGISWRDLLSKVADCDMWMEGRRDERHPWLERIEEARKAVQEPRIPIPQVEKFSPLQYF